MPTFSILTSTYNSGDTLQRLYLSLLRQSYKNFEWIIVDDFSPKAETRVLIEKLAANSPFPIKYHYLSENYFGARSTFMGTQLAEGQYACILDHDDELASSALEMVWAHLAPYLDDPKIAGVCGRCVNERGDFIGGVFPASPLVCNEGEIRFQYGVKGEFFQFTRISILAEIFKDMKPGYTNGWAWAKISESYDFIYVNSVLRVYDTSYVLSYSNTPSMHIRYPDAKAEALLATLQSYAPYLLFNIPLSLKIAGSSIRHRLHANASIFKNMPLGWRCKLIYIAAMPLGYLKYKGVL